MKQVYFVFGAEGSGTYMLAEAFVSSACAYDDKMQESISDDYAEKVVVRLSFPCKGKFLHSRYVIDPYKNAGYFINSFVIFRDMNACVNSIIARTGYDRSQVEANYRMALVYLGMLLPDCTPVIYESFVENPGYRKWLFESVGLKEPTGKYHNANKKYYERGLNGHNKNL